MRLHFLTYSSRSGSTFLAKEIDTRLAVTVVPETQFTYHILSGATPEIDRDSLARMVVEDRQIYWIPEDAWGNLDQSITVEGALVWIAQQYADYQGVPLHGDVLFKMGGALHIWSDIQRHVPNAKAINIQRDGRAVVNSSLRAQAPYMANTSLAFGDPVRAAKTWRQDVRIANTLVSQPDSGVIGIRYEDLIYATESEVLRLGRLLEWTVGGSRSFEVNETEADLHTLVGRGGSDKRLSAWETELSERNLIVVEAICRRELSPYGLSQDGRIRRWEKAKVLASAKLQHGRNEAKFAILRLRRVRNRDELMRKATYMVRRKWGR